MSIVHPVKTSMHDRYLCSEQSPEFAILENVWGVFLKSANHGAPFDHIKEQIDGCEKYRWRRVTLAATDLMLPQRRCRLYIIMVLRTKVDDAAMDRIVMAIQKCRRQCC